MIQAGGGIADAQGNPTVNRAENVEAITFFTSLVTDHKVAPPDAPDMTNVEIHNLFLQGRASMVINPQYQVALNRDPSQSKVVDKWDLAELPKKQRGASMTAGQFFVIPKSSKNKQGAMAFARACVTPDEQVRVASKEGLPARLSAMDPSKTPGITSASPYAPQFQKIIVDEGVTTPKWLKIDDCTRRISDAVQSVLLQKQSAQEALDAAQKDIVTLVKS
jgi:ABC-type glycerol-3-phosphate transport system substrate-binding protein